MSQGDDRSREEKRAALKERFRQFRNDPGLVRGSVLAEVEINKRPYRLLDKRNGASLAFSPGRGDEADPANFIFVYGRTADEITERLERRGWGRGYIQGEVEQLVSQENGPERIFVLKKGLIIERPGAKPEPYTLSDEELARIADLFATLMQPDPGTPWHDAVTFVAYDHEAVPWTPDPYTR